MKVALPVTAILALACSAQTLPEPKLQFQKPSEPVFIVTVNSYASGFKDGKETAQFGDLLLIGLVAKDEPPENTNTGSDENAASVFYATTYFHPGARFKLFHGGAPAGAAVVSGVVDLQCDSRAGQARLESKLKFKKDSFALATNGDQVKTHPDHQRPASSTEQSEALIYARQFYVEQGVQIPPSSQIEVKRLVYTEVDGSNMGVLVGTFYLQKNSAGHQLFAILGKEGSTWKIQFSRYNKISDLEDFEDTQSEIFVDQLDLDGDGLDEIVTGVTYYEAEDFRILKRHAGAWYEVYKGGEGGC